MPFQNMTKNKCENRTSFEIFEKNQFIQAVQRNFINKISKFYKSSIAQNHNFEWLKTENKYFFQNFYTAQDSKLTLIST